MHLAKLAVSLLILSCLSSASVIIQDNSFEDPLASTSPDNYDATNGYYYRPTGTAWTFSGSSGVTGAGYVNGFDMSTPPDGNQAAILQKGDSMISQTITGLTVGASYEFYFYDAQRPDTPGSDPFFGGGQDFSVYWNNVLIGTFLPSSTTFTIDHTGFFTATSDSGTLLFMGLDSNSTCNQGLDGTCDRTAFIDDVQIGTPEPTSALLFFSGLLMGGLTFRRRFAVCFSRVR